MKHSPRFLNLCENIVKDIREITTEDLRKKIQNKSQFELIDVREDNEWKNGYLPGAMHLSKGIIERDIELKIPDTRTEIVLYCGGGFRSAIAAENLQKMGYTNVYSLQGGYRAWQEEVK